MESTHIVEYRSREVYGRILRYPVSAAAVVLADLIRAKTLNARTLEAARRLGLEVREVK